MSERYVIYREDEPNLAFEGEIVASDRSIQEGGIWQGLTLYKTRAGKFVCSKINHTCWEGQSDDHYSDICRGIPAVVRFFGYSDLAKGLYALADIKSVEIVE